MVKFYAAFLMACVSLTAHAQISKGKDFWFSFLQNYYQQSGEMRVYITTETACSGTISSPLQGWSQGFTVTPGVSTQIIVPYNIGENFSDDQISLQALHVNTTECVSVFAHWYQGFTSDAAVIFPVNSVGRDYIVQSWYNPNYNNGNSEFAVIATEDNTNVQITLSVTENGHPAGVPYTITLDSGQVYQIQSSSDLTGSRVVGTNNKNFSLMAGHVCANVGNCGYCDMLYEQMYPLSSWGTEYITVPYSTRDYDIFRIIAQQNGTQVVINGGAPINLNAGQFYQYNSSAVSLVTSNFPISMMQYSTGSDCDGNQDPFGDPFMIVLSPTSQSINQVTYTAFPNPDPQFTYYTNIIAKTSDLGVLTFDGANIAGSFSPVPQNPALSYAQLTITQGDHTIAAPQGVIANVYGYGPYESYGYAAGVRVQIPFLSVYDTSQLYCPNDTVYLSLNTPDTARIVYIEWNLGDGSPPVLNTFNLTHVYPNYGDYPITIIYELQSACKKDTAVIDTVKIRGPNVNIQGPTQFCSPQNAITFTYTSQFPLQGVTWNNGSTASSITISAPYDTVVTIIGQNATCYGYDTAYIYVASDTAGFTFSNTCEGDATVFTNTSKQMPGVFYTWEWNFGDGTPLSAAQSPTHTYTVAGNYQVKLKYTSSIGCVDSITKTVVITGKPNASFTFTHVCNDSILTPGNTSTISNGTMSYAWNFGDGTPANTQQNPQHDYAQSGLYNVQLIASSGPGCADTFSRFVNVIIGADLNFAGTSVCLGNPTLFTDLSVNNSGSAILNYNWYFGDGDSSNTQNTQHTYLNSGTYNVTMTVDYGSSCTESFSKTVFVNPLPDANFTVADACNSGTVNPVNNTTITQGNVTYSWNFGDGSASVNGNAPPHTYSLSGNYTILLTAVSDSLCSDTTTRSVNVIRGTLIDFSAPAVCEGLATTFTDLTTNPYNSTIVSYQWSFGDGAPSNQQNTTHTYATFGTYNVQLLLSYGNNCADSLTKQVVVNEKPVAAFTVTDVCNDSVIQPANTSAVSSGSLTYNWSFGDGNTSSAQNPVHAYQQTNTYVITLVVNTNAACADTTSDTATVIIGTIINFDAPPVCAGNNTVFTDQTTNPYNTSILSYAWSFGDGATTTQQNPTHTYAAFGTYSAQLLLDYGNNCADSLTKAVTVNEKPVAAFVSDSVCAGNPTTFTNTSTPSAILQTYNWSFGDNNTSAAQSPQHVYAAAGPYTATLIVFTNQLCSDTVTGPVYVRPIPPVSFTVPDVCPGVSTSFVNNIDTLAYPVNSLNWNFGDGSSSSSFSPTHLYGGTGNFAVTLTANFATGCTGSAIQNVVVFVQPSVTASLNNVSCYSGNDGAIDITPANGQTPFSYSWSNSSSAEDIQNLTAGTYSLTFTDANNCTDSATYSITEPTALNLNLLIQEITCAGYSNGSIEAVVSGGTPGYSYNWNTGQNSFAIAQLDSGFYVVTVSDANGCTISDNTFLPDPLPLTILLNPVDTVKLGQTVQLSANAINGNVVSWLWTPANYLSCADCPDPLAGPYDDFIYTVQAVDDKGCTDTAQIYIRVLSDGVVFIPNAFSPNGDGANDYFEVYGNKEAWKQFAVEVFNRIGEKVYESNDMNFRWDGTYKGVPQNPQVFVYTVSIVYLNNRTEKLLKGSVTLLK